MHLCIDRICKKDCEILWSCKFGGIKDTYIYTVIYTNQLFSNLCYLYMQMFQFVIHINTNAPIWGTYTNYLIIGTYKYKWSNYWYL